MTHPVSVVILAAGSGTRMNNPVPKQFLRLGDDQLLDHAIGAFLGWADQIVVTLPDPEQAADVRHREHVTFVQGGATRTESVLAGLAEVRNELVLVHDAARPFVTAELLEELTSALEDFACACPVMPVVNSIVVDEDGMLAETPDRSRFRDVQTPQAFRTEVLRDALGRFGDAHPHLPELVRRAGHAVKHVEGSPWLFKITYEPSMYMANYYLEHVRPKISES